MKKITLLAMFATGIAMATFQSCKDDNDSTPTPTPTTSEIRDLSTGTFTGVSVIIAAGDTFPDSTQMTVAKGTGNTFTITDEDGVVIKTGEASGTKQSLGGNIPTQTVTTPEGTSTVTGTGVAGKQFTYAEADKTFKVNFKATIGGDDVMVNFTGKK